jgi:hypothetical protein
MALTWALIPETKVGRMALADAVKLVTSSPACWLSAGGTLPFRRVKEGGDGEGEPHEMKEPTTTEEFVP